MAGMATGQFEAGTVGPGNPKIRVDMSDYQDQLRMVRELPDALHRRRVFIQILKKAVDPVKKAAQARLPDPGYKGDKPGLKPLKKTIGVRVKEYSNAIWFVTVGPQWTAGAHGYNVEHGHRIVTGGTLMHRRTHYWRPKRGRILARAAAAGPGTAAAPDGKPSGYSYGRVSSRTGEKGKGQVAGRTKGLFYMEQAISAAQHLVAQDIEQAIDKIITKAWEQYQPRRSRAA